MFLALSLSDGVFIMLINVKISTIVMSRINFVLSRDEHGKRFITSGPDQAGEATNNIPVYDVGT